jgi:hypothetical protein
MAGDSFLLMKRTVPVAGEGSLESFVRVPYDAPNEDVKESIRASMPGWEVDRVIFVWPNGTQVHEREE